MAQRAKLFATPLRINDGKVSTLGPADLPLLAALTEPPQEWVSGSPGPAPHEVPGKGPCPRLAVPGAATHPSLGFSRGGGGGAVPTPPREGPQGPAQRGPVLTGHLKGFSPKSGRVQGCWGWGSSSGPRLSPSHTATRMTTHHASLPGGPCSAAHGVLWHQGQRRGGSPKTHECQGQRSRRGGWWILCPVGFSLGKRGREDAERARP